MAPEALNDRVFLYSGDCLDMLKALAPDSVDAVVTDPPYHLTANKKGGTGVASVNLDSPYGRSRIGTGNGAGGFMGKAWDGGDIAFRVELWREVLRVLKPGGHVLAFSATRTYHRMAVAIEDAGFEIRDSLMWVYSQGFPKSHNLDNKRGDLICGCGDKDLHHMRDAVDAAHSIPNGTQPNVLSEMRSNIDQPCADGTETRPTEHSLQDVRNSSAPSAVADQTAGKSVLQQLMPQQDVRGSVPGNLGEGSRSDNPRSASTSHSASVRPDQSILEGRRLLSGAEGQLRIDEVRSMSAGIVADGAQGRICDGAQSDHGATLPLPPDANGVRAPSGSQPEKQFACESGTVAGQSQSQDGGAWPHCGRCGKPMVPRGLGSALKPAFEPIVLARKPLGTGDIKVRENIERAIRSRGWTGNIQWQNESAESAASQNSLKVSSKTQSSAGISVANAVGMLTTPIAPPTATSFDNQADLGTPSTDKSTSTRQNDGIANSVSKSLNTTVGNALVAASENLTSSRSTTSAAAERNTEGLSDERFMPTSASVVSPQDSERFAGIATGLSDFMETVHIKQEAGLFVWPENLPTFVPSKPLTVAANVLRWRTGALNIDGCRVDVAADEPNRRNNASVDNHGGIGGDGSFHGGGSQISRAPTLQHGRWPANVVHDGSDEVVGAFPSAPGQLAPVSTKPGTKTSNVYGKMNREGEASADRPYTDHGSTDFAPLPGQRREPVSSAARFFYSAKASKADRNGSKHPTVKPISLIAWLCRLITPPGGMVLDPFAGTGTTGEACMREGFRAVLIERESEYQGDIRRRIKLAMAGPEERSREIAKAKQAGNEIDFGPLFGNAAE